MLWGSCFMSSGVSLNKSLVDRSLLGAGMCPGWQSCWPQLSYLPFPCKSWVLPCWSLLSGPWMHVPLPTAAPEPCELRNVTFWKQAQWCGQDSCCVFWALKNFLRHNQFDISVTVKHEMGLFPLKQTKMGVGRWGHHLPVTQRMWCLITWGDRWRKRTILNAFMAQGLALWTGLLGALVPVFQQCFFSAGSFSKSHLLLALLPHLSLSSLAHTVSFLLTASELSVLNPEMQFSC